MIINIRKGTFGDCIRNGDLIGVANIVEHLRKINKDDSIRFWIDPEATSSERYVQDFHTYLLCETDYFSAHEGQQELPWKRVNVWDFRDISGDLVKISNNKPMQKKIVIFPVLDAPYNIWRNWPKTVFEQILKQYDYTMYAGYEKIICSKEPILVDGWKNSTDIIDNLNHISTAEIFVGGDTGTSHFAWALDRGPKDMIYYGSSRGLIHTLPFYLLQGKGRLVKYWLDCEGTIWN
jgi:hypothetical protein